MKTPRDVDEYLATVPAEMRPALDKLRKDIRAAAPDAEEVISYQIPTYKQDGMLLSFGAWKNHCAVYGGSSYIEAHKDELSSYDTSKGTIRFPPGRPLPAALVTKLVRTRIKENEARKNGRKK